MGLRLTRARHENQTETTQASRCIPKLTLPFGFSGQAQVSDWVTVRIAVYASSDGSRLSNVKAPIFLGCFPVRAAGSR
jgi:hypothetical protein